MSSLLQLLSKVRFYAILAFLTIAVLFIAFEIGLKFVSFSMGAGLGSFSQRWFDENWKPINSLGFRDTEIDQETTQPVILFLGDSFTAGHGIRFEETYYFLTRKRLKDTYYSINISLSGSSTVQQKEIFNKFLGDAKFKPAYVIHQYFGNDINDYLSPFQIKRGTVHQHLIQLSDVLSLLDAFFYIPSQSEAFVTKLKAAYQMPSIYERHFSDVALLHTSFRALGANTIFVIFPFLHNAEMIEFSRSYTVPLKHQFSEYCSSDDILIDMSAMALSLSADKRIVNPLDAHASATLNQLLSNAINQEIAPNPGRMSSPGVMRCKNIPGTNN